MPRTKTSLSISWNDEPERFCFLTSVWDVQGAKRILREKPHRIESLDPKELSDFVCLERPESGKFKFGVVGIDLDRLDDPEVNLEIPLIVITTPEGNHLPIDGWHRVARALRDGVPSLPVVVLTKKESSSIQL